MKSLMLIICGCLSALPLSGCVGLMVFHPAECENETPIVNIHKSSAAEIKNTPPWSTKSDFLLEWGKPDIVTASSDQEETWTYKRDLYCGVVPCLLSCLPIVWPYCEGYDRIDFRGERAIRLHTKVAVQKGGVAVLGPGVILQGNNFLPKDACRYPTTDMMTSQNIQADKTAYLSVTSYAPEDSYYFRVLEQIKVYLSTELVASKIFNDVVRLPDSADYGIYIVNTYIDFSQIKDPTNGHKIRMSAQIYNLATNQLIGEYELHEESALPLDKTVQAITAQLVENLKKICEPVRKK